ncbi:MAG TPA: M56 family metallopeptidase [Thermoanaerobaculia bacterium]|nr:M56 family metallopeptidase [Thermoanaerobaculia bacterium]
MNGVGGLDWALGAPAGVLAVRSCLVLAVAALVAAGLRRTSAALRHRVWSIGFAGLLLLLPLAAALGPVEVPVLPPPAPTAVPEAPGAAGAAAAGAVVRAASDVQLAGAVDGRTTRPTRALLAGWVGGALLLLVRQAWLLYRLRRLRHRAGEPPPAVAAEVRRLAQEAAIRRRMRVVCSAEVAVPATWGLLRPVVALPAAFARWPKGRRRRVLLHELAHVRRCDAAHALLAELAVGLYWWNPLAWYAARRAREECESAADERVLAGGARPSEYAADLLAVARSLAGRRWTAALTGMASGSLRRRIEGVLAMVERPPPRRARVWGATLGGLAVLVLLCAVQPVRAGRAEPVPLAGGVSPAAAAAPGAIASWQPQQLRWAHRGAAGAFFLEGELDLARLAAGEPWLGPGGLLVWFQRGSDGSWKSLGAYEEGGRLRGWGRAGGTSGFDPAAAELVRTARALAPDWRDLAGTFLGPLDPLATRPGRRPLGSSGSNILGVPGSSRDPGAGVLQAGWYEGGERVGVFVRGPVELGAAGDALAGLPADGWLAAFGWDASARRLRLVEALPGPAGVPTLALTEGGEERPVDAAARRWLGGVLTRLPGWHESATRLAWRD